MPPRFTVGQEVLIVENDARLNAQPFRTTITKVGRLYVTVAQLRAIVAILREGDQ